MSNDTPRIGSRVRFRSLEEDREYVEAILLGIDLPGRQGCGSATAALFQAGAGIVYHPPWILEEIDFSEEKAARVRKAVANLFEPQEDRQSRDAFFAREAELKRKAQYDEEKAQYDEVKQYVHEQLRPMSEELRALTVELSDDSRLHSASKYERWTELSLAIKGAYQEHPFLKGRPIYRRDGLWVDDGNWCDFFQYENSRVAKSRQVLSSEYLESVAAYLAGRLTQYNTPTVLDAASGLDPRFASFVNLKLKKAGITDFKWLSVDSLSLDNLDTVLDWKSAQEERDRVGCQQKVFYKSFKELHGYDGVQMEQGDVREVIGSVQPDIVLSSWMPQGVDLAKDFRSTPSVQEYILIGPQQVCGTGESWKAHCGFEKHPILHDAQSTLALNMFSVPKKGCVSMPSVAYSYRKPQ